MKIIFDGQALKLYPFGKPGFSGGTEGYCRTIARGLALRGHQVHVVTSDLDSEEQRGEHEYWWGPGAHPTKADFVVAVHNLESLPGYTAQHFILMPNGIDPWLGPDGSWAARLSTVACFSACHRDLLTKACPTVPVGICRVTGLGVTLAEYHQGRVDRRVPGRMLWANDPTRGLHHLLQIFDHIHYRDPRAELFVAYDFERQFETWRYQANATAERLWECKDRIEYGHGVQMLAGISRSALVALERSCDIHVMPSDPLNVGSQIHGLTQLEMAAAGVPLVLSDIEAFPEIFPDALHLPVPGTFCPSLSEGEEIAKMRRYDAQDWADHAVALMKDRRLWGRASRASRSMAKAHDWSVVLDRWEEMLGALPLDKEEPDAHPG